LRRRTKTRTTRAAPTRLGSFIWTGLHGYVTLCHAGEKLDWPTGEELATMLAEAWLGPYARRRDA